MSAAPLPRSRRAEPLVEAAAVAPVGAPAAAAPAAARIPESEGMQVEPSEQPAEKRDSSSSSSSSGDSSSSEDEEPDPSDEENCVGHKDPCPEIQEKPTPERSKHSA